MFILLGSEGEVYHVGKRVAQLKKYRSKICVYFKLQAYVSLGTMTTKRKKLKFLQLI